MRSNIIKFRRSCPLLGRTEFMTDADITWHESNWDDEESRFLAFTYHDRRATYLCLATIADPLEARDGLYVSFGLS